MEINDSLVNKLALLARLHFSGEQKENIKTDLEKMIRFVDKLNELDTHEVEPLRHINLHMNILREDIASLPSSTEVVMQHTLFPDSSFFKVPRVISK